MQSTPRIGPSLEQSTPGDYSLPRPTPGAPNVVLIVLDDLGFGQLGCFGSDIATPAIDGLAAGGLRYNHFHVTSLCSPTRACLMTGRNHHAVGMGFLTDIPMAFPGYTGRIPKSATPLPRVLRDAGYNTLAVGKWHLVPGGERSSAGPFDRWPLGFGFERYYGFLQGDTNHWAPHLVRDNHYVEQPPRAGRRLPPHRRPRRRGDPRASPPSTKPRPTGRSSSTSRSARCTRPITSRRSGSSPTAARSTPAGSSGAPTCSRDNSSRASCPRAPTLGPRPSWIEEWSTLAPDAQRMLARQQELFAGFLVAHRRADRARARAARAPRCARRHVGDADLRQRRER